MDIFSAVAISTRARSMGAKQMIFDWNKAAQLIKERLPKEASAGLRDDWDSTGGTIYENGEPKKDEYNYLHLSSNWAVPELDLDGEIISCYIKEDNNPNEWNAGTVWPESALEILRSK